MNEYKLWNTYLYDFVLILRQQGIVFKDILAWERC